MTSGILDRKWETSLRDLSSRTMKGTTSVRYCREPDFFQGLSYLGDQTQVVGTWDNLKVLAYAVRSQKKVWFRGAKKVFGSLGNLRLDPDYKSGMAMARGYLALRAVHNQDPLPGYLVTIVEGNIPAHKVLRKKRPLLPEYLPWGKYYTLIYPVKTKNTVTNMGNSGLRWCSDLTNPTLKEKKIFINQLPDLHARAGQFREFYPVYDPQTFESGYLSTLGKPGTEKDSCWVWLLKDDHLVAAACVWNQQKSKQIIIEKYPPILQMLLSGVNLLFALVGWPKLPSSGELLNCASLSCWAVEDNDPESFKTLLEYSLKVSRLMGIDFLMAGFHEKDIFLTISQEKKHLEYLSDIYLALWDEKNKDDLSWDGEKTAYLELGTL